MQANPQQEDEEVPQVGELTDVYPHWDKLLCFLDNRKEFIDKKLEKDRANIRGKYEPWRTQIEQTRSRKFLYKKNLDKKEKDFNEACSMERLKKDLEKFRGDEATFKENIKAIKNTIGETKDNIKKKKELVMKYKIILQHKSRRNISLASLATKLSYELTRAKQMGLTDYLPIKENVAGENDTSNLNFGSDQLYDEHGQLAAQEYSDAKDRAQLNQLEPYGNGSMNGPVQEANTEQYEGENQTSRNQSRIAPSGAPRNGKLKAEGLYRRINRIYLRDLDIFYTFKDC